MIEVCKVVGCDDDIKSKLIRAFPEEPRMVNVIWCESGHRQFGEDGKALRSPTSDIGVMQLNIVHWKKARELGLDIFNSVDDNIKMGRIIYDTQGIKAWMALKSECYKKISSKSG